MSLIELFRQIDGHISSNLAEEQYKGLRELASPDLLRLWEEGLITSVELLMNIQLKIPEYDFEDMPDIPVVIFKGDTKH